MRHKVPKHVLLVGGFTFFLTSLFYLAHDNIPSNSRLIGWQAYGTVDLRKTTAQPAVADDSTIPSAGDSSSSGEAYEPIFPLDFYAPLLPNPAPLTEITIESCLPMTACFPRTTALEDATLGKWVKVDRSLNPTGQMGLSASGMLHNLFGTIEQRYLFYRKSRRRDVQNIVEIRLVEQGDPKPSGDDGWHKAKKDLRSKVMKLLVKGEKNLHLYFRTVGGQDSASQQGDKTGFWRRSDDGTLSFGKQHQRDQLPVLDPITELDLVYGDNPPWPGFELGGIVSKEQPSLGASRVSLSYRRKPQRRPPLEPLKFKPDGSFKILQLADLHFSVNPESCRDIDPKAPRWNGHGGHECMSKNDTFALIDRWLDDEKPDLVVLTGDQLNGQTTSWDPKSVLALYTQPLIARKIPYAVILGNHDSESGDLSREEQMHLIQNLPYSYSMVGPTLVTGEGNYYLKVLSPTKDRTHLATLWFMDTGTHAPKDPWKPWSKPGYGYIHKDQINWFESKFAKIKPTLQPYHPDGAEDLGPQWTKKRRYGEAEDTGQFVGRDKTWQADADQHQTLARPPSIVFMHIPVPEAFHDADASSTSPASVKNPTSSTLSKDNKLDIGWRNETATFQGAQSQPGIFDLFRNLNTQLLRHEQQQQQQRQERKQTSTPRASSTTGDTADQGGIKMIVHGHMHNNSNCRRVNNIWICFGGGSSFAGYGDKKISRRSRVIQFENWATQIRTWHKFDLDTQRYDEFVLPFQSK